MEKNLRHGSCEASNSQVSLLYSFGRCVNFVDVIVVKCPAFDRERGCAAEIC